MLELIRKNAQGIVIWIIVGLVILGLSSFILSSYMADNIKNYAAKVNDREISNREFQIAFNNYQQQLQQSLGENYSRYFNEDFMRESVINGLVNNELITQLTIDAGFRAGAAQIYAELANNPRFQDEKGKFSTDKYEKLLRQVGYSKTSYEADVAQSIVQRQFSGGVQSSAFVLEQTAKDYMRLEQQQRDVAYLNVSKSALLKNIQVTADEIKDYYEKNKQTFMSAEQIRLAYIELNIADIAKTIEIDDEELKAYYNQNKATYSTDDNGAAEKRIREIETRAKKGEAFDKLATEFSQDPGSAAKGGDLGFFAKGLMAKEFEEATFKLKVGEISKPVKTQFGYHLIKLEEIRGDERRARHVLIKPVKVTQTFSEVKNRILHDLQITRAEKHFYEDADKLDKLAYEFQDSLEPAAEQLAQKIKESPYITRAGDGKLWRNREVLDAAFSESVFKEGLNSGLIKLSDDHMLVLRLKDHKPAQQMSLESVTSQIEKTLKDNKIRELASTRADELLVKLREGKSHKELADSDNAVTWLSPGFIGRKPEFDEKKDAKMSIPPNLRLAVFSMPKPTENVPAYKSVSLNNGDTAVVVLRAVREKPDNGQQLEAVKRHLADAQAKTDDKAMLDYIRSHSKIDINKQKDDEQ